MLHTLTEVSDQTSFSTLLLPTISFMENKNEQLAQLLLRKSGSYGVVWNTVQHADDGYSRRRNFGGSLVHSIFNAFSRWHRRLWFKS